MASGTAYRAVVRRLASIRSERMVRCARRPIDGDWHRLSARLGENPFQDNKHNTLKSRRQFADNDLRPDF
jgi:hypothetical protein